MIVYGSGQGEPGVLVIVAEWGPAGSGVERPVGEKTLRREHPFHTHRHTHSRRREREEEETPGQMTGQAAAARSARRTGVNTGDGGGGGGGRRGARVTACGREPLQLAGLWFAIQWGVRSMLDS